MAMMAIHFFTFIFNVFGVSAIPAHFEDTWKIEKQWTQVDDQFEFRASTEFASNYCRHNPDEELVFPQVVHSSQVVKLDGKTIASLGKRDLSAGSPFYQQLTINCDKILEGRTLEWTVLSYSFYFSRLNEVPYFAKNEVWVNFLNVTMNYFAFAILLALSIFTFIIYKNRVPDRLTYGVSIGSFFLSIYFANASNLLFGFSTTMLLSHKIADISLWIGIFLFYYAYEIDGYSSRFFALLSRWACLISILVMAFSRNGDVVQFGTILPMAPMAMAFIWIIRNIYLRAKTAQLHRNLIFKLLSVGCFLIFGLNDIFHITGIINTAMTLSFGIIGCIFGLSVSVAQEVDFAYQERDEFRKELEAWAPPFILKAIKYERIKFPIRKDLAAITYDIVNSSKYHDVFVDGRPLRAVILQGFSESIIRNGGWRESHSGDSAYAHFGVLKTELPANALAFQAAIEFKDFLDRLNKKHSLTIDCGIGLHIAKNVLINVHSIEIKTATEVVQQKSFDTTSADVDLVHRLENFVHKLPGTNIALSEKFVDSLDFKIVNLIELGRFQLKGQIGLTNIFVIPNEKTNSSRLKSYFDQAS